MDKQVKMQQPKENDFYPFYLTIYNYIKSNSKLPDIGSRQKRNYYLSILKKAGLVERIGYGTWAVVRDYDESLIKTALTCKKKITQGTQPQPMIRGHAFQFTLAIPEITNWQNRKEFLDKNHISWKPLNIINGGEKIYYKGAKIWLTNKSIIIHQKSSYLADSAKDGKSYAIYELLELIKSLESLFSVSFQINKQYKYKVTKQHYSRLNCLFAKQYRKDGKKLYVRQEDGTAWLWTDYSLSIDETETGNTDRSDIDMDEHIHPFLNGLREVKGFTPQYVNDSLAILIKTSQKSWELAEYYGEQHKSHIKAIQQLGIGVEMLHKEVRTLKDTISQRKLTTYF